MLGTDHQEKEPPLSSPREGSPPMVPELPGSPSLYPNVPPYPGALPPQKATRVCPLVKTGGEFIPTWAHKTKNFLELRWIKQDLGSYTDDPGKYTDTFQHITLVFDLTRKDIMVIFSQTLSDPEHQFSSFQFSHSVVSDSLRPHELQHARPPCPSPTPGVHPNSWPSSR